MIERNFKIYQWKTFSLPVSPCPKPRQTRSDVWKKRPVVLRYRAFADQVRDEFQKQRIPTDFDEMIIVFRHPMPKSWSKKKRRETLGKPMRQRPDIDNVFKALSDAVFDEDSHIHSIQAKQVWDEVGAIELTIPMEVL